MLQALVNGNTGFDSSRSITDPTLHPVGPIPDCTKNLYLNAASCYEFVYAPNNNAVVNVRTDKHNWEDSTRSFLYAWFYYLQLR